MSYWMVTELDGSIYSLGASSLGASLGEGASSCEVYLLCCGRRECRLDLNKGCFLKFCSSSVQGLHPSSSRGCVRDDATW
jgi:hypothetical protein